MKKIIKQSLRWALLIGVMQSAWSEDIEIYIGQSNTSIKHNLLFILDLSESMRDPANRNIPGDSRVSILNETMNDFISTLQNIRVGYIRMNGSGNPGGNVNPANGLSTPPELRPGSTRSCSKAFTEPVSPPIDYLLKNRLSISLSLAINNNGGVDVGRTSSTNTPTFGSADLSNNCGFDYGGTVLFPVVDLDEQVNNIPGESGTGTVRDRLLEINDAFITEDNLLIWTPTVPALYEAATYWSGGLVRYGIQRGVAILELEKDSNSPDLYEHWVNFSKDMFRTLTSHPGSWSGGVYKEPPTLPTGVTSCQFSRVPGCQLDRIEGRPNYISPINNIPADRLSLACTKNHQILLTDGLPTRFSDNLENRIMQSFTGVTSCNSTDEQINAQFSNGRCAVELVNELATKDLVPNLQGEQYVNTHTIAFALNDQKANDWLGQIANAGNGRYYAASNATDLSQAFNNIVFDIFNDVSSFVAPSVSVNAFNRIFSRDQIYFGLFQPSRDLRWNGNLKKYGLCLDTSLDSNNDGTPDCSVLGSVLDANYNLAVDSSTSSFMDSAISFWSAGPDGADLLQGGAGDFFENRDIVTERIIYTEFNHNGVVAQPGTRLDNENEGYKITDNNYLDAQRVSHIHNALCGPGVAPTITAPSGVAITDAEQCHNIMVWFLGGGLDVTDEDDDNENDDPRWWFNDILHSSPVSITYGVSTTTGSNPQFIDKILVGSNGGGLHMINADTGQEEWVFIPEQQIGKQRALYENQGSSHQYGLDGGPVVLYKDVNGDQVIDGSAAVGDSVTVFIGQRRGGNNIYALDITPGSALNVNTVGAVTPDFKWRITGGVGQYSALAQTWSDPIIATIQCDTNNTLCGNDGEMDLLIFGGGYDPSLDNLPFGSNTSGDAIYMVDADTGTLFHYISSNSISTSPRGLAAIHAEMKYAIPSSVTVYDSDGDGYDDRLYVGDVHGQVWRVDFLYDSLVVGRLAAISNSASIADHRRFFNRVEVVQVRDATQSNIQSYDYVVLSSGERPNPLDETVIDRLYAFRDFTIDPLTAGSSNAAVNYPTRVSATGVSSQIQAITEYDMVDITNSTLGSNAGDRASEGWYYKFSQGEKGLAAPTVVAGTVFASTYLPPSGNSLDCDPDEGLGQVYNFDLLTAAAVLDWNGDGAINNNDRVQQLGSGIPSEAVALFSKEGVALLYGTGGGAKSLGSVSDLPRFPTYWEDISQGRN